MGILGWVNDTFIEPVSEGIGNLINAAENIGEEVIDAVVEGGAAATDWAGNFIEEGGEWLEDRWEDTKELADKKWQEVQKFFKETGEELKETMFELLDNFEAIWGSFTEAVADGWSNLVDAIESAVSWVGNIVEKAFTWLIDEALPAIWAIAKVAALVFFAPLLLLALPFVIVSSIICTWVSRNYGREYGCVIEGILSNSLRYNEMFNIIRLPAREKYFISSDLHLYASGNLDTAEIQNTKTLYKGVLEYYSSKGFSLIENGDVEDYWLRGGSGYGVAYDMASYLPTPMDSAFLDGSLKGIAESHLVRIVNNNLGTYSIIRSLFHDKGRYHRTIGNHDDVYSDPIQVEALRRIYPNVEVADYITLEEDGNSIAIICHGHQTDSWNAPACSFLGKIATSVFSTLRDIPFVEWQKGILQPEDTERVWKSEALDEMGKVSPWLGVNTDLGSLDEVELFNAFHKIWGDRHPPRFSLNNGPYLILGHTHGPLAKPGDPDGWSNWERYFNSGSGIFFNMLTGVEWDGTADPLNPVVKLVAWKYDDDQPNKVINRSVLNQSCDPSLPSGQDTRLSRDAITKYSPALWNQLA